MFLSNLTQTLDKKLNTFFIIKRRKIIIAFQNHTDKKTKTKKEKNE